MKKIFTLLAICMVAVAANAKITIYVNSTTAPFIWWWGLPEGQNASDLMAWPGTAQFTEKITHESGLEFWTYSFAEEVTQVNFLLNDGAESGTKQTGDVNGVKTDRYFTWDGASELVDITTDITGEELPDAEVTTVSLSGNHNGWSSDAQFFEVVEAGKVFRLTVDTGADGFSVDENLWQFKFRPNAQDWVGYWDVFYNDAADPDPEDGRSPASTAPAWLTTPAEGGNFQIDLETVAEKVFTFTATWNGGKEAGKNWVFQAVTGTTGITTVKALNNSTAAIYNLQGQRVDSNYRGIAIQNGKKMLVK